MITIIDLILVILFGLFFIKNIGGLLKTTLSVIMVIVFLIVFGLIANWLLNIQAASFMHDNLKNSYFVKLSNVMIKLVYPAVEKQAPKLDTFIKENILTATGEAINITPPVKALPKIPLPTPEPPKEK